MPGGTEEVLKVVIDELESCGESFPNSTLTGCIWKTEEHDKFKHIKGNRAVKNVKKLKESISKIGFRNIPIIVNKDMGIADGQNRHKAATDMRIPELFIIDKDIDIDCCRTINSSSKSWKQEDYIKSYADLGNPEYIFMLEMMNKYPKVSASVLGTISCKFMGKSKKACIGGNKQDAFKDGTLIIKNKTEFEYYVQKFNELVQCIHKKRLTRDNTSRGKVEHWIAPFDLFYTYSDDFNADFEHIKKKIEEVPMTYNFSTGKCESAVSIICDIYNYDEKPSKRTDMLQKYNIITNGGKL